MTPDLTCLGKGIANGYPLSAVCGRADIMKYMEEVFFSFTMGGETLSLAAACAAMDKMEREPVVATLAARGEAVLAGVQPLIDRHGLGEVFSLSGHPSWSFLNFANGLGAGSFEIKTLFMQEVFARGVLAYGTHNMSYSHSPADVERLIAVYDEVFGIIAAAGAGGGVRAALRCEPLVPLFKVR